MKCFIWRISSLTCLSSLVLCLAILVLPNLDVAALSASISDQEFKNRTMSLEYLGLQGNDLSTEQASNFNFEENVGFLVTNISKNSPADKSNLEKNDVIIGVDNDLIRNNLQIQLNKRNISENISLTVVRDHMQFNIPILDKNTRTPNEDTSIFKGSAVFNFSTYHDLEFSMKFPSVWRSHDVSSEFENQRLVWFVPEQDMTGNSHTEYVNVQIFNDTGVSLEDFLRNMSRSGSWMDSCSYEPEKVKSIEGITLGDFAGKNLTSSYCDFNNKIREMIIGTAKDSKVYVVSYYASDEKFNRYLPIITEMIESLQIHDVTQYSDRLNKLIMKYPSDIIDYDESLADSGIGIERISFALNRDLDQNSKEFQFVVDIGDYYGEIEPLDHQNNATELNSALGHLYVNYELKNISDTRYIFGQPSYQLEYTYYDPFEGNTRGILYYTIFQDIPFLIKYENRVEDFEEVLPLILDIVNSIEFLELNPLLDSDDGIYFQYPSKWQMFYQESDKIKFGLEPSSNLTLWLRSNLTTNDLCYQFIDTNKSEDDFDGKCYFTQVYGETGAIMFEGEYDDLNDHKSLIDEVIYSGGNIILPKLNSSLDPLVDEFRKGAIIHPFSIKYNNDTWDSHEQTTGYIGKDVRFTPKDPLVSLRVTYWNENNLPMIEEELSDRNAYSGPEGIVTVRDVDLGIEGFSWKSVSYLIGHGEYTLPDIVTVFYGKSNSYPESNVKITYGGPVRPYLENWPVAKQMIESVRLNEPIERIEPHGVEVGRTPSGIFYDENDNIIFVSNSLSRSISLIDTVDFRVLKDEVINLENTSSQPFDLAYNSKSDSLYVVHNNAQYESFQSRCESGSITKIEFDKKVDGLTSFDNANVSNLISDRRNFCPIDIVVSKENVILGDPYSNRLFVVDENGKILENKSLGEESYLERKGIGLVLDDTSNRTYIANPNYKGIQIFNIKSNEFEEPGIKFLHKDACPIDITVDQELSRLYVADTNDSCTESLEAYGRLIVIDSHTGEIIKDDIRIGKVPNNVAVDKQTHKIYVTNSLSDTITVIDPLTFEPRSINVGVSPFGVTTNPNKGLIYVTSQFSDSVSMINTKTNEINHLITFKVSPIDSGTIKCQKLSSIMIDKLNFVPDYDKCIAEPTKLSSWVFHSWSDEEGNILQNTNDDSTKSLIALFLVNPLTELFGFSNANAEFPVKTSGTFTANFVQSQSLFTQEQLIGLYTLAAGIFSTWFIPNLTRWIYSGRKSRVQNNTFSNYLKEIQNLDKHMVKKMREGITDSLSKGKLSESQYHTLDEKLSKLESN